jgi:hypothetical protein
MKKIFSIALIFLIASKSDGQMFSSYYKGEKYYQIGTKCIERGDYKMADSLLTIALRTYKNSDVYFNRGISRLFLKDTVRFCTDMDIAASKYHDAEAEKYFIDYCCKHVDTFYYDKNMVSYAQEIKDYRYLEFVKEYKYSRIVLGTIHDVQSNEEIPILDFAYNLASADLSRKRSNDIIAQYTYIGLIRYYLYTSKFTTIGYSEHNGYEEAINRLKKLLTVKYTALKAQNCIEELTVGFQMFVTDKGEISSVNFLGVFPDINFDPETLSYELRNDIQHNVRLFPGFLPARFNGKKVFSIVFDQVTF